jgi:hypothetical protein
MSVTKFGCNVVNLLTTSQSKGYECDFVPTRVHRLSCGDSLTQSRYVLGLACQCLLLGARFTFRGGAARSALKGRGKRSSCSSPKQEKSEKKKQKQKNAAFPLPTCRAATSTPFCCISASSTRFSSRSPTSFSAQDARPSISTAGAKLSANLARKALRKRRAENPSARRCRSIARRSAQAQKATPNSSFWDPFTPETRNCALCVNRVCPVVVVPVLTSFRDSGAFWTTRRASGTARSSASTSLRGRASFAGSPSVKLLLRIRPNRNLLSPEKRFRAGLLSGLGRRISRICGTSTTSPLETSTISSSHANFSSSWTPDCKRR